MEINPILTYTPIHDVEYKNKLACFYSISNRFITKFMDESDYEKWRKKEYGKCKEAKYRDEKSIYECCFSIRLNRTHQEALIVLCESGLSRLDCSMLLQRTEKERFCTRCNKLL